MILKFVRFKTCINSSINVTTRVEQLPGESEIHAASSVLIGRAHTEWHNGTALSWYETEPAWKTRNDRISVYSVAPPEYCFVRKLSKPIFESRINWQRWNYGHYVILCFCWSPESAWISPRFSALELIIEALFSGFRFRMFDVLGWWCRIWKNHQNASFEFVWPTEVTQHFRLCRRKATLRATVPREESRDPNLFFHGSGSSFSFHVNFRLFQGSVYRCICKLYNQIRV